MATEFDQESQNPYTRLLKNAVALSPMGLAGFVGLQKVHANTALNPIQAARNTLTRGQLGRTGETVGASLAGSAVDTRTRMLEHGRRVADEILKADNLQKIWSTVAQQEAVIQSILDVMNDPSNGIPESILMQTREQLADLAAGTVSGDEAETLIKTLVRSINDNTSENTRVRWAKNIHEYSKIGPQLAAPLGAFTVNQPVNQIDPIHLKGAAKDRYERMVQRLGADGQRYINVVEYGSGSSRQVYARMYSGNGPSQSGRFLGVLPLDLGTQTGYSSVRMNENLSTGYRANRYMIDAQAAEKVLARGGGGSAAALLKPVGQGGASVALEDLFINEFFNRAKVGSNGLSIPSRNDFGAWQRQFLAADWRITSTGQSYTGLSGFQQHLRSAAAFEHNFGQIVNFGNMGTQAREHLIQNLSTAAGMESGVSAGRIMGNLISTTGEAFGDPTGTVGIYEGSALQALNSASMIRLRKELARAKTPQERQVIQARMRTMFPVTSRIEQVVGRESMFVGSGPVGMLGRGADITAGPVARFSGGDIALHAGRNADWSTAVTGASNKAMILDVSGSGRMSGLAGSGVAYSRGRERALTPFTKPVLDPAAHGVLGSKFMNEVIANMKEGEMRRLSTQEIKKYGGFLGLGPGKIQQIRMDPRAEGYYVGFQVVENMGKRHVNIIGATDRGMETWKGFGLLHKGTVQEITEAAEKGLIDDETLKVLSGIGIPGADRIYGAGDMLKKGPGFIDVQMTTGYGLVTGEAEYASSLAKMSRVARFGLGDSDLARSTGAVLEGLRRSMAAGKISAQEAGMVLAGVYHSENLLKGLDAGQAVSRDALASAVNQAFDPQNASEILRVAAKGIALGASSMTMGTGVGDYGLGRGSAEPRFFSNMQFRLRRMGLSQKETSDFLASVYQNKMGYAQHLTASRGLLKMAESVTGQVGAMDTVALLRAGVPSYGLNDLVGKLAGRDIAEVMAEHPEGFVLDLTSGASTPGQRAVAEAARGAFGQGQLYLPGSDVVNAMRDTFIKTTDGDIRIDDEYSRMVQRFLDNVVSSGASPKGYEDAEKLMSGFKKEALGMAAKAIHTTAGGKIRGMQAAVAGIYDLTGGTGFSSDAKAQLAWNIFKKTQGRAVFMDTKGFLSQLKDYMGGTLSTRDAANRAEMFFLGMEEPGADPKKLAHNARGIHTVAMRHPLLSVGNVQMTEMYRHVEEVGRGTADEAFANFIQTEKGKQYARFKGFHEVARANADTRVAFFKDFVGSLDEWVGEGGGRLFLPRRLEDVHYLGPGHDPIKVDIGMSGAAIGDWDGDQWYTMMTNKNMGNTIDSTLRKQREKQGYTTADQIYKIKSEIYTEEAKSGLKKVGLSMATPDELSRIRQDIMKEAHSKAAVGSLDVQLNRVRMAILDMQATTAKEFAQAEDALAMLKVIQEHAVIKGKKLPVFRAHASMIKSAVQEAFSGQGIDALTHVLKTEIFPDSQLWGDGVRVSAVGGGTAAFETPEFARAAGSAAGAELMQLDQTLDFINQAINRARTTGVADMPSIGQMTKMFESGNPVEVERAFHILRSMQTAQGGMLAGFAGDSAKNIAGVGGAVMSNIRAAAQRLDSKTAGLLAMGGMAALGMAGLVGSPGYAPTPLVAPGEIVPDRVKSGIAAGEVLQAQREPEIPPQSIGPRHDQYGMNTRPINSRTTYMQRNNAYQIRGQIHGEAGLASLNNYLGSMGGRGYGGSVRINDNRRPITPNYIDRLLGEY